MSLLSYCTSSIQFCDTSNVSDLILQCTSSYLHVLISKLYSSFQASKFMTMSLKYLLIGRKHGCHARLGLSINKKPLRHFCLRHSGFFNGAGRIMLSFGHLVSLKISSSGVMVTLFTYSGQFSGGNVNHSGPFSHKLLSFNLIALCPLVPISAGFFFVSQ